MPTKDLIQKIEQSRGSNLITYITGDREPFKTKIKNNKPAIDINIESSGLEEIN